MPCRSLPVVKHGGLLQTSGDAEIWIFSDPSRQGVLLPKGDNVNLGQPWYVPHILDEG